MTSTAINSQYSTFAVGSTPITPKAITGISLAHPAVITAANHGLSVGDVVTINGVVGMTQVNGFTGTVQYANANSFVLADLDTTQDTAYGSGGTVTSAAWTPIANIKTFTGFDGSAATIDISNLQSTAKEYLTGLKDLGKFSLALDLDTDDPGQTALLAAQSAQALKTFKLTLPNNSTCTFSGLVLKVTSDGGVEKEITRAVDIQISGDSVWTG